MWSRLALLFVVVSMAACATVDGAGQDISAAGNAVSDAANDVQDDL